MDTQTASSGKPSTAWAALRGAVIWEGLQSASDLASAARSSSPTGRTVLDAGGGTGGLAVPFAELGHDVVVVDPSPDSLAALERRASDSSVVGRVRWVQGDLGQLRDLVSAQQVPARIDLALCHSVLELVDDPADGIASIAEVLTSGGLLSIVAATRAGAVLNRAVNGHFNDAATVLSGADATWPGDTLERRFDRSALVAMIEAAGLTIEAVHGIRVVSDLVPGGLLDSDSSATAKLLELERALSTRPELLDIATQLHIIARKP